MSKKIIIDAVCNDEIRVATIEGDELTQFEQFNALKVPQKGNIYLGKVTKIERSLQAAFVEYDTDEFGFLPIGEVCLNYFDQLSAEEKKKEDKTPYFYKKYNIQDILKEGSYVIVQVIKDKRGHKGATVSTYILLAGKYCVFTPYSSYCTISKQISNLDDRKKLEKIVGSLNKPEGSGIIIRTAASSKNEQELTRDYTTLLSLWKTLRDKANKHNIGLLHQEVDIIKKTIRDTYDDKTHSLIIEDYNTYKLAKKYAEEFSEKINIKMYKGRNPIFAQYKIDEQVNTLFQSESVYLQSGGHIIINPTEALTAIDVNSGRMTSESNTEETAYKTNLEAAKEIVKQIELRGIAGIIVIDFIDMVNYKYCHSITQIVEDEFKKYRAKVQVSSISRLGLMEISKQRTSGSLSELNTKKCQHCGGSGRLVSRESAANQLIRDISSKCTNRSGNLIVYASREVALYMLNEKRNYLKSLEDSFDISIYINIDNRLANKDFRVESSKYDEGGAKIGNSKRAAENSLFGKNNTFTPPPQKSWIRRLLEKIIS